MFRWGRSRSGSLRFKCEPCGQTFTPQKKIQNHRYQALFRKWVLTGTTLDILKQLKGSFVSERTLKRYFHKFLKQSPQPKPLKSRQTIYLKIDGTYFGRWGCLLVFKERTNIIYWDFVVRENYFNYALNLGRIKELGYDILGVTSDWHGSLVSAVKAVFPDVPHQRCLVHTQRLCQSLLTRKPETEAGQNLLELVSFLNSIKTASERSVWIAWLRRFEKRYGDFIRQRTYGVNKEGKKGWWFTHRNLRRSFMTLKTSLPNLFIYLDNPNIEKDTNGLESEFSHLEDKLGNRRGLSRRTRINYLKWYCYLKSLHF